MFVGKSLAQLLGEAEQIVVGTVTATQAQRLPTGLTVTDVTIAVERVLKGDAPDPFVLRHAGGTVDGVTLTVRGAPEFRVGRRYVVFVTGNGTSAVPVVGGEQGLFQVVPGPSGAADVVLSARGLWIPNAAVLGLPAPPAAAKRDPAAPLTLPVFLEAISTELAR